MTDYDIIELPLGITLQDRMDLQFKGLTKKEAQEYKVWFRGQMPGRLKLLQRVIRTDPDFSEWTADDSVESLSPLG